ncbi:MAG: ribosome recycling factor [Parachlamydiaceae bacterium]|nr:ribosome recycling factor [Parachlamydiaceae bacterium]
MDIVVLTKTKMNTALEHLKNELKSVRTGRANPGMLDNVMVEVYGSPMRLKDIASITTPESRLLLVTPFDPKHSPSIGKAIEKANLGVMPIVDGNLVRIKIAPMDDSMRKTMIKQCYKILEETKIAVRNIRRDSNETVRKQKSDGTLPEDMVKKTEKKIQELTDETCKEADNITAKKEKEVSTI